MPVCIKKKRLPDGTFPRETWTLNSETKQAQTARPQVWDGEDNVCTEEKDKKGADFIRLVTNMDDSLGRVNALNWRWAGRRDDDKWTRTIVVIQETK